MLGGTCLSHECVHPHIASHSLARSGRCIMRCTAHIDSDASASMLSSCNAIQHRIALSPPRGLRDQSVHATCRMPRVHATHMHARRAPRRCPRAGSAAVRQRTATDRPAHTVGPLSPLVSHSHLCARWHLATMGATWPLTCPDLACMQHPEFRPIGVHDPLPPPTPLRPPPPL